MNPVLPNADDPRGGTPMNTDDELRSILNDLIKVASGFIIAPNYTIDTAQQAITALLRKSNLHRAIDELKTSLHEYERTDFETGGSDSHQHYLRDRIAELQAELQQAGKGDV